MVYVLDSGFDADTPGFEGKDISWLILQDLPPKLPKWRGDSTDKTDCHPTKHGTSVLGKIVGDYNGVAKAASIVVVPVPRNEKGCVLHGDFLILALREIYQHVIDTGMQGKAVINISIGKHKRRRGKQLIVR